MKSANRIQEILNQLLISRGIVSPEEQKDFFNPQNPQQISVSELGISDSQLKKAIQRIKDAIDKKEKIVVYGDYDVDGICATAILWETLDSLGADALPYIPSRFTEGYGLSQIGLENLKSQIPNAKLVITVDSGIVAFEGVEFAKKLGIDVIITDHHEPGEKKPDAFAIIHTQKISGSGVSWILSREIDKQISRQVEKQKTASPIYPSSTHLISDHLSLAALGTIADVLPLVGFNRSIAKFGLEALRKTTRLGIKALCEEAIVKQEEIDTYHIGFMLAPRINAAGRVENAMDSLRLLCARNPQKANELAKKLGSNNRSRQEKTEFVVKHVQEKNGDGWNNGNLPKLLFVHHESYEEGVIGIAAGRLVDQYHRPAIVISRGEEFSKASVRSISGVNIIELLRSLDGDFFKSLGGHPMAAGFTIETEKLEALANKLQEVSEKVISDELLVRSTRVDMDLNFEDISLELDLEIQKLAPFGFGNPEPVFRTKDVNVVDARPVGRDNSHLKLVLSQNPINHQSLTINHFDGIAFKMGELQNKLSPTKPIEIIYSLDLNEWNGRKSLQLKVKNIKI